MTVDQLKVFEAAADSNGYRMYATPCKESGNAASGGVLILYRKYISLIGLPYTIAEHRAVAITVKMAQEHCL